MSNYPDIALFAPLGSGKSTVADYLVREFGYTRLAFANEVKHLAAEMVNVVRLVAGDSPVLLDDINRDKTVYRPFLQWLGTDLVREHMGHPNFWVDRLLDRIATMNGPVVVDDMRFPNEASALKEAGFQFVRIDAPERRRFDNFVASTTLPTHAIADTWIEINNHASESHYADIARIAGAVQVVDNDDDYDTLFERVEDVVMTLIFGAGH